MCSGTDPIGGHLDVTIVEEFVALLSRG
jgi:hypothetical protein